MAFNRTRVVLVLIAVLMAAAAAMLLTRGHAEGPILKASNWSEVKAYQYGKTPGLERAEKLGLTR